MLLARLSLRRHFPWVCWRLGITSADIQLVIDSLEDGLLEPSWLSAWSFGKNLADVSPAAPRGPSSTLCSTTAQKDSRWQRN